MRKVVVCGSGKWIGENLRFFFDLLVIKPSSYEPLCGVYCVLRISDSLQVTEREIETEELEGEMRENKERER